MRHACLFLVANALLPAGCAFYISAIGKDLTQYKTKEAIHAQLGEPVMSSSSDGGSFEEFRTRRKISEAHSLRFGEGYAMLWFSTFGAIDLIAVPSELCLICRRTLLGQTIRVTYNADGTVIGIDLAGESLDPLGLRCIDDPVDDRNRAAPAGPP